MRKKIIFYFIVFTIIQVYSQNKLPQIILKNTEGRNVDISTIETNNVTIFSFWATWCVPCINELDAINDVYSDWQLETNVKIITIAIDDNRTISKVKPFVNGKEWNFTVLYDKNQELKRALNVSNIPYLIIVKNNKIVYTHMGYTPGSEIELFEKIKQYAF